MVGRPMSRLPHGGRRRSHPSVCHLPLSHLPGEGVSGTWHQAPEGTAEDRVSRRFLDLIGNSGFAGSDSMSGMSTAILQCRPLGIPISFRVLHSSTCVSLHGCLTSERRTGAVECARVIEVNLFRRSHPRSLFGNNSTACALALWVQFPGCSEDHAPLSHPQ